MKWRSTVVALPVNHVARTRQRRGRLLLLGSLGISLIGIASIRQTEIPWLVWNGSASAPLGLYRRDSNIVEPIHASDWLLVRAPTRMQQLIDGRDYLPPKTPLIKQVRGLPGQTICRFGLQIFVDGKGVARALTHDDNQQPMPRWQGCHVLDQGEYFLLQPHPRSFDGRYFGAVHRRLIIARLQPVWTWESAAND
jgi:conjugative transfer signal peptidase TraF